jgi:hypothetical protein
MIIFFPTISTNTPHSIIVQESKEIQDEIKTLNGLFYDYKNNTLEINLSDMNIVFEELYKHWKDETSFLSSTDIFDNIYYQRIIALGNDVVPVIINKLNGESTFLFYALHKITGENPVLAEHRGDIVKMTQDWKNWWDGNRNNFI